MEIILKQDVANLGYKDEIVKVGENGQLFGGISNIMVAEALKEQHNYDIDRKQIVVENIKAVGTYTAKVNVYKDIKAELNIEVVAE